MQPSVYIMANEKRGTLYIGVTSDLVKRVWQHKLGISEGFTSKYALNKLVYYEQHVSMYSALEREKHLKKWNRQWKLNLIYKTNPEWDDLWDSIIGV